MSKVVKGATSSSSVTVGVRIRPLNGTELAASMPAVFGGTDDRKNVEEMDEEGDLVKAWPFDHAFGNDCDNAMIFKTVGKTLVEQALEGYNTVLFMYGQTSSGKTFTLFGGGDHLGLVTHAMEYVHKLVHSCVDKEYIIKITYAELYNEELKVTTHEEQPTYSPPSSPPHCHTYNALTLPQHPPMTLSGPAERVSQ
jgi:hypothetical protein